MARFLRLRPAVLNGRLPDTDALLTGADSFMWGLV